MLNRKKNVVKINAKIKNISNKDNFSFINQVKKKENRLFCDLSTGLWSQLKKYREWSVYFQC